MKFTRQIFNFAFSITIFVFLMTGSVNTVGADGGVFEIWYGTKSWEDVEGRLDNFIVTLRHNPDKIGYIIYTVGKNDSLKKAKSRIDRAVKHIVEYRKFDKRRLIVVYSGRYKETITILHLEDKNTTTPKFDFSDTKTVPLKL